MKRKYQSPRRVESKSRTIADILDAAVRLHGQGITEVSAVAAAAGVSVSTVHKYFPTREELFRGCTTHMLQACPPPPPESWAGIADPGARLVQVVTQVYALHEATFGQNWTAHKLADESPVMAETVAAVNGYVALAAEVLLAHWPGGRADAEREGALGFVRGLLSPLAYRALRLSGGLDPEAAARQTVQVLARWLQVTLPPPQPAERRLGGEDQAKG